MAVAQAVQAVVPVQPTNVVVTQHEVYNPHATIEQLGSIIPVQPDDTGPPAIKKARESTGKWKGYDSKRVFKKEWEERYAWVSAVPEDPTLAYCKICGKKIRAHKGDIEKHQKTKRHLKKQTTSDILADLIPISCEGVPHQMNVPGLIPAISGPEGAPSYQNLDGTKNNDIESNGDARVVPPTAQVPDGQQQIIYFTESAVDSAHQAANTVIDKLVEKYHQRRLDNLKIEHEAILQLYKDQLLLSQRETQSKVEADAERAQFEREEHEARLRFMQEEHNAKLKSIEEEHNAKLRAIEQELLFAQQEYEKKMRLLDVQLSSINKL
ncbi:uncharacterized protein LOC129963238 isoform X1 [Argiope bruennichi]|uniref:Uncharacterized protein n=1 Tax=Argiope bruennichi TaxID=94029 RepID=A0A8T0EZK5_ARGBR|nr:uncharacterized protein LOC129963238 isoform X1 [Argiope bruennichi]KAF8783181.1 hypothetical protein HNY73_013379 [Argiope bruennichi]